MWGVKYVRCLLRYFAFDISHFDPNYVSTSFSRFQFFGISFGESGSGYCVGQNIGNKVKKSSKTGQDHSTLISVFAYFLTAIAKVLSQEERLGITCT